MLQQLSDVLTLSLIRPIVQYLLYHCNAYKFHMQFFFLYDINRKSIYNNIIFYMNVLSPYSQEIVPKDFMLRDFFSFLWMDYVSMWTDMKI